MFIGTVFGCRSVERSVSALVRASGWNGDCRGLSRFVLVNGVDCGCVINNYNSHYTTNYGTNDTRGGAAPIGRGCAVGASSGRRPSVVVVAGAGVIDVVPVPVGGGTVVVPEGGGTVAVPEGGAGGADVVSRLTFNVTRPFLI